MSNNEWKIPKITDSPDYIECDCNNWIKCSDRLPDNGKRVLFVCKDLNKILMGHHIRNGLMQFQPLINGMESSDPHSPIIIDMTHWQPLPAPPEDE